MKDFEWSLVRKLMVEMVKLCRKGNYGGVGHISGSITSSLFMFSLIYIVGALISVFLAAKFLSEGFTLKELLAQFGGVLVPFSSLKVLAILSGLMGSVQLTYILTGITLLYAIVIMPAIVVYDRATKSHQSVN